EGTARPRHCRSRRRRGGTGLRQRRDHRAGRRAHRLRGPGALRLPPRRPDAGRVAMTDGKTPELMTTREVADYLRLKERRIYELVRQRAIPCTRVTGKWLFPKPLIDLWLARNLEGSAPAAAAPPVVAGSQDPLLEWAVKESGCGLALLPGGSLDGLARFAHGEAVAAALHLFDPESGEWNRPAIRGTLPGQPAVAIAWARRRQGLVVAAGNPLNVGSVADLARPGLRFARRQT